MQVQFSLLLALAGVTLGWPGLSIAASPQTRSIRQHSEGACSPPIVNNQGHVSISCPGVTPEALRYLENQLSDQFGRLNEQLRGLDGDCQVFCVRRRRETLYVVEGIT